MQFRETTKNKQHETLKRPNETKQIDKWTDEKLKHFRNYNSTTDSIASGLSIGDHYITVTDFYGCVKKDTITIIENDSLLLSLTSTPASCYLGEDGTASIINALGVVVRGYLLIIPIIGKQTLQYHL